MGFAAAGPSRAAARVRSASTAAERAFFICLSFAYLASVAIPLTGFFHPVKDFERGRFFRNTFRFRFLVWDNQWNVPLLVGVVAIALIGCNAWLTLRAKIAAAPRYRAWLPVALTGVGVVVVVATVASDRLIGVNPIKEARNVGAFASAGFACLFLLFGRRKQFRRLALDPCTVGLIGALTLVQFGWYTVATTRWAEYVRRCPADRQYVQRVRPVRCSPRGVAEPACEPVQQNVDRLDEPGAERASRSCPNGYGNRRQSARSRETGGDFRPAPAGKLARIGVARLCPVRSGAWQPD